MPRAAKSSAKSRHEPLHIQLDEDEARQKYGKVSQPGNRRKISRNSAAGEDGGDTVLDTKTSQRIFELAKDQQEELEIGDPLVQQDRSAASRVPRSQTIEEEDLSDEDRMDSGQSVVDHAEEIFQIDPEDLDTMDAMLPANVAERRTLADLIFAKLDSSQTDALAAVKNIRQDGERPDPALGLDPKVVEAYTRVGLILRGYRSGPLPKLFKVVPTLPAWARILALTRPESWSPHACRAATRLFISTMKPPQAQLFLQVVLLDAIREDIRSNKKLNVHYYEALKRALYKPSAFFKGIIFPMLETGCTLKEAAIIASILPKTKVPVLHASAALLHIANMDYSGPNSLFIRVLIDKKYELPYKVVDALVFHFIRLSNTYKARTRGDKDKLPVLWHQSLLAFAQRYASDVTPDQKDALLDVVRVNPHPQIGPEIRRELVSCIARGEPRADGNDVVMS